MNILSIQSHVVYGHVGNSAAVFPLQRIGVEVWPVHTVQLSNHTGYGGWRGDVFSAESISLLVQGLEERGVLGECDGVISGYLGSPEIGEAVAEAVIKVKRANPAARYCCDPVMGDSSGGMFVAAGIPELIRERLIPLADFTTPNQFELEQLAGRSIATKADALAAVEALYPRGPRIVFVTSLATDDTPSDCIDLLACDDGERCRLRMPRVPIVANGAGDAVAALFFAHHMSLGSASEALSLSASAIFGVLNRTAEAGASELLLVEAQQEFVAPSQRFVPQPV
ncbi:MAG: pyridoxal kinase PdxY [Hyphomicrobiales bacterium]|nr:pyridoxal kinase PdxY [Hyphomicrobiales bacterium]